MYWKIIFLICFIAFVGGFPQTNLDDLIDQIFSTTTAKPQQSCKCVPYYTCEDIDLKTDGVGIIDIRVTECKSYLEVCCPLSSIVNITEIIKPPAKSTPIDASNSNCGEIKSIGIGPKVKSNEFETEFGEYPWMVAIFRENTGATFAENSHLFICGGSLIHWKVVVTAAHCVMARNGTALPQLKIRAGDWDIESESERYDYQERNVAKIITHLYYRAGALSFDIALLILESPVFEEENTGLICLSDYRVPIGEWCFSSGWGKNILGNGRQLKKMELQIIENNKCENILKNSDFGKTFSLHISYMCAEGKEIGTNQGDNGGPLVCLMPYKKNRYMLSGIIGVALNFKTPNTLGMFTNVPQLTMWITNQLSSNNIVL
ncbi:phenoloxidase-activating factor 2-like [Arctopsyche grandis]|uniref:phenoloxidase-activating factor 2-like n=1 Tax=Arctopsyche grandis TaxID=121162 RepID=UPI00406D6E86